MSQYIIDVSEHQGKIDWERVRNSDKVVAAIIRCGYGRDIANQDDDYWQYNVSECERLGIPYGVYLYSYAMKQSSINSEVQHALRLLQGHKPQLPVFFDSEQKGTQTFATQATNTFCSELEKAGYKVGVYASESWFKNYLAHTTWLRWIAKYGTNNGKEQKQPNVDNVWAWQYTSNGQVDGVAGRVDMSVVLQEDKFQLKILEPSQSALASTKSVDELAHEVINNQWGNGEDRKNRLTQAGYNYSAVQARVNEILSQPKYTVGQAVNEILAGQHGTGNDRKAWCESVGLNYQEVQNKINAIIAEQNQPKYTVEQAAQEIINGQHGTGTDRQNWCKSVGLDYNTVQARVNQILEANKPKPQYSIEQAANEIIAGKHGTGNDRVAWCQSVGLDYNAVQNLVNQKLSGHQSQPKPQTARKSITQVAKEVIQGKWGNNPQRAQKLRAAGYNPNAVQAEVNRLM